MRSNIASDVAELLGNLHGFLFSRILRSPWVVLFTAVLLGVPTTMQAQTSPAQAQSFDSCVEQWRMSRGVTSKDLPQQVTSLLKDNLNFSVGGFLPEDSDCNRANVLLDKIRSDATAAYTAGQAKVSIGNELTDQATFSIYNDQIAVHGPNVTLSGSITKGSLVGTAKIDNQTAELSVKDVAIATTAPDEMELTGVLFRTPKGLKKNAPVSLHLRTTERGLSMEKYLGMILSSEGEQYKCEKCPETITEAYRRLVNWTLAIITAPSGYLLINSLPAGDLKIYVDDSLISPLPSELSLPANKTHVIRVLKGSSVKFTETIILSVNQLRSWSMPIVPN